MTKIPVLDTIRAAYQFTFTHLGAIIGLIWLPMILATVIGFFVLQRFFAAMADAFASNNFALMGPALLGLSLFRAGGAAAARHDGGAGDATGAGQPQDGRAGCISPSARWNGGCFAPGWAWPAFSSPLLLIVSMATAAAIGRRLAARQPGRVAGVFYRLHAVLLPLRFGFLLPAVAVAETGRCCREAGFSAPEISGASWRVFLAVLLPVRLVMMAVEVALEGPRHARSRAVHHPIRPRWWRRRSMP